MLVESILPDLAAALLPTIEFTDRLAIRVDLPADGKPTISVEADGVVLPPVAGEITLPDVA